MHERILNLAKSVLEIESRAVSDSIRYLNADFVKAAEWIYQCKGKLVVTGIGKSGQIARKIASTFSSTGTPAIYLHPAESSHGDLGIVTENDVVLALSYGGESYELNTIITYVARKGIKLIAMTGKLDSSLAKSAQAVICVHVQKEACPLQLAPTASTTTALAMGDALAMSVLMLKGFTSEDFAQYHPGGSLGKLLTRVKDLMHVGDALPIVNLDTEIRSVLSIMTHRDVRGCAGVVDAKGDLAGVVTDGDIRRRLEKNQNPLEGRVKDIMTLNPRTIDGSELAEKALFMMEEFRIQLLFVLDKNSATPRNPIGLLHLQDLIKAKIK